MTGSRERPEDGFSLRHVLAHEMRNLQQTELLAGAEAFSALLSLMVAIIGMKTIVASSFDLQKRTAVLFTVSSALNGLVLMFSVGVYLLEPENYLSALLFFLKALASTFLAVSLVMAINNLRESERFEILPLRKEADTDSLTRLPNRGAFFRQAEQYFHRARKVGGMIGIILFDLDHFKQYNDDYGHPAGDQALRRLAEVAAFGLRGYDVCARYGGEEFIVLAFGDLNTAQAVAERIHANVSARCTPDAYPELKRLLTISVGVAALGPEHRTLEDLVKAADQAMYQAKSGGRNRICIAGRMS